MAVAAMACVEGSPYSASTRVSSLTTGGDRGRGSFSTSFITWPTGPRRGRLRLPGLFKAPPLVYLMSGCLLEEAEETLMTAFHRAEAL
ncbi:hypothetical protein EYF80_064420 [Liparis tanakae]|uniref:Uncharacterized protein n=1 Tax=Liparis tanakae TaxID=230148 RepID=A0A4Z2E9L8_9TELE|nr:hypothetical protein EYF80_064420 [Liparis tanakae]